MYAVKKQNPLSFRAYNSDPNSVESDEVYCDFLVTEMMIYDSVTNTVRVKNDTELLNAIKISKEVELKTAHEAYVTRGFNSNALGSPHTYFTNDAFHWVNTLGAGIRGIARKFECKDGNGVSNNPMHTFLQLQTVLSDGDDFLQTAYDRKWDLINSVRAIDINATYPTLADAEAAIAAIVWTDTW